MRFAVCEQIWHGFGVLHRHLLLMMDFDCPSAFCHKRGNTYEFLHLYLFLFSRGEFIFVGWSLWSCFRLYLGASLCILPFQLLPHLFYLVGIFMLRGVYFFMFLVSNCLLIYVYEFFIDICLYCVLFEIKILFYLLVFFPHMRLCILFKCFRKYTG